MGAALWAVLGAWTAGAWAALPAPSVCARGADHRAIAVRPAGGGCEAYYTKEGKERRVAQARWDQAVCAQAQTRIVTKLEQAGFTCGAAEAAAAPAHTAPVPAAPVPAAPADPAQELWSKSQLGALRAAASQYSSDSGDRYPQRLADLVPKYRRELPVLRLADHPATSEVEIYDGSVCAAQGGIDMAKVRHTGKWGYVYAPGASCHGTIFIDCSHPDSVAVGWATY